MDNLLGDYMKWEHDCEGRDSHWFYFDLMFNCLVCHCGRIGRNNSKKCDTDEGPCSCGASHMKLRKAKWHLTKNPILVGSKIDNGQIIKLLPQKEKEIRVDL